MKKLTRDGVYSSLDQYLKVKTKYSRVIDIRGE